MKHTRKYGNDFIGFFVFYFKKENNVILALKFIKSSNGHAIYHFIWLEIVMAITIKMLNILVNL